MQTVTETINDRPYLLSPEMYEIHTQSLILADMFAEAYSDHNYDEANEHLELYIDLRRSLPVIGYDDSGRNLHWGYREANRNLTRIFESN